MKRKEKVKEHLKHASICNLIVNQDSWKVHLAEMNQQYICFQFDNKKDIPKLANKDDVQVHAIYDHNELIMHGKLQYIDDTKTTFCLIQVRVSFYTSGKLDFTYDFRDIA
ncbi:MULTISPECIES: hypothetical protein [unclassified Breznakia]|uniref:hypothetical protein n=1 Tax=unclassified Breznakia TaxID=2623764 RepID=UPI00247625DE|nr:MULTISPECIES: hypothetical protein [unclassified Breznakia]MDH6368051.1 putative transcriptional regulator [Breznakia sp. PH1-1]MDH6405139.1 putative transcriptional regulator [Breznakia sp. PF1-11]MDH6412854.1 putative transcriptional regulator [Breznakia sp. PFB1-11]MDH6415204.1 putative transcriptional regulator [Breznakia sp. PFB1-14]MDH6417514.1 putative transcriptional regulator [Breznakia sp. PFB1-4]